MCIRDRSLRVNMRAHLKGSLKAEVFYALILKIIDCELMIEEDARINIRDNHCDPIRIERIYPILRYNGGKTASWLKERAILIPKMTLL